MDTDRPLPLWATLTADSTREEVLAAVQAADEHRVRCLAISTPDTDCGGYGDADPDHWDRTEAGDVTNGLAFDAHMNRVGEEDQYQPGWDQGP